MFGEGYSLPIIFNDDNSSISLQDVQNCMPNEITVTAWSLTELSGEDTFEYGDRILGRVIDWNVTARFRKPFVKVFEEEREMTVMLLIIILIRYLAYNRGEVNFHTKK